MIDRVCHDVVYFCDKITHFDLRYFPWKLSGLYLVQLNRQWVVKISLDCAGNRLEEIISLAKFILALPYLIFFIDSLLYGLVLIFANILIVILLNIQENRSQ